MICHGRIEKHRKGLDILLSAWQQICQNYPENSLFLPSRHEGFPVAPLEAMACSLPVIATDVPGMEEILAKQEQHGGIIIPKNDISALVQALYRLIDNDTLRYQLGKKARHRLENAFSLKVIGKQLQQWISPQLNV